MKDYMTEQRKLLMRLFEDNIGRKMSIDDIQHELEGKAQISRSAIYRNIDKMAREGLLEKTVSPEGRKTFYRFNADDKCCERLHLRCEKCGKLMHLQSEKEETSITALLEKNGFELDEHATVLFGVCTDCK